MDVVELVSVIDYWQDWIEGGQVWFFFVDSIVQGQMGKLWCEEIGLVFVMFLVFEVKGCKVELLQYVGCVVCVSFWDLCGKFLGFVDYFVVVEVVDVLFLDNILCFS